MGRMQRNGLVMSLVLGTSSLFGCAGQTKTNTAHDEAAEHGEAAPERDAPAEYKMPESPKTRADDMGR